MSNEVVTSSKQGCKLSKVELSKITEFFTLLIKIDNKKRKEKNYANQSIQQKSKPK